MALKPIKVSQLNKYIGRIIQTDPILGNVSVTGEVSNFKLHSTGHIYFTLKDESSRINCFMPAGQAEKLRYEVTDGMEIVASGYISVYEKGGYYSLYVRDIEVSGAGDLALAYRALYEKLFKEGIFDSSHKKPLPALPRRVCVITSPTGAAVRDIIKIIKSRSDIVDILIYPCLVQGGAAAAQIAAAVRDVNARFKDVDVIITGRGGGSLEDLWAFNEEVVARSIYNSEIPVISAVGHETDFSISDYAADARAETPTAAAVMAVPDTFALRGALDDILSNMSSGIKRVVRVKQDLLSRCTPDMMSLMISGRIKSTLQMTEGLAGGLHTSIMSRLSAVGAAVEKCGVMLEAGSPEHIINRGYAIVYDAGSGKAVTDAGRLKAGMDVRLRLRGGTAAAQITDATL